MSESNVRSLWDAREKKKEREQQEYVEAKIETCGLGTAIAKNKETQERVKREREQTNENIKRVFRLRKRR